MEAPPSLSRFLPFFCLDSLILSFPSGVEWMELSLRDGWVLTQPLWGCVCVCVCEEGTNTHVVHTPLHPYPPASVKIPIKKKLSC